MQQVINDWIQGPLTKYVKTRMASPEDEVRRLAEQGVLHMPTNEYDAVMVPGIALRHKRERAGFPGKDAATTPLGITWERQADRAIETLPASVYQDPSEWLLPGDRAARDRMVATDAWLDTVPGTTPVHRLYASAIQRELGFPHLIDELRNALDPESGLPRHLQLTPEAMKNMSMEKAVRRVADINAWRAAQKAETNQKFGLSMPALREYAENNPKGLRWVELKAQPKVDERGLSLSNGERDLADQLKYEGDTMGHCVGGYCDDVLSGRSRIFSLRDAKGEPHVTVEVAPPRAGQNDAAIRAAQEQFGDSWEDYVDPQLVTDWSKPKHHSIVQIKGKQNRAPKDEYLPFVQDFVRQPPEGVTSWGSVGDLHNAGLFDLRAFAASPTWSHNLPWTIQDFQHFANQHTPEEVLQKIRSRYPDEHYITNEEFRSVFGDVPVQKKAGGGRVSTSADLRALIQALEAA